MQVDSCFFWNLFFEVNIKSGLLAQTVPKERCFIPDREIYRQNVPAGTII
jgi:hypothetical protein